MCIVQELFQFQVDKKLYVFQLPVQFMYNAMYIGQYCSMGVNNSLCLCNHHDHQNVGHFCHFRKFPCTPGRLLTPQVNLLSLLTWLSFLSVCAGTRTLSCLSLSIHFSLVNVMSLQLRSFPAGSILLFSPIPLHVRLCLESTFLHT